MRKVIVVIVVAAVLILLVMGTTVEVTEAEFVIVEHFGDPTRVLDSAGLHVTWPPPVDTIVRIDRRMQVLDPDPAEYLTSDKKNVLVACLMLWSVEDPVRFRVSVTDKRGAEARLTDIMLSEVGTVLGLHPLSSLVSVTEGEWAMEEVTRRITENTARKAVESFGVRVETVRIRRLNFPRQNKQAVFERMEAERERIATQYRSEGVEAQQKIEAQARRDEADLLAEARRKAEEIRGEADAESTRIYAEAFGRDPDFYEFIRSLEVYRKIIGENTTLVVPSDSKLLEVMKNPEKPAKPEEDGR
ncbi:MAG: protease modulator HflC [Planctomycetota bacterium]|jgi:membrane protease subunit HflC